MKILALECSAGPASVAIIEDNKVLASSYVNIKLTHSQTLMPMVEALLSSAMISINDISGIAIAAGPGSFTGIRIGISAAKGLAAPKALPCVAVSTLRGMAENFRGRSCVVCAVMDARCNQVYNALFRINGNKITRLCEDRALMCNELAEEISKPADNENEIIICGDGSELFYPFVKNISRVTLANEIQRMQNAASVGLAAYDDFILGNTVSSQALLPFYLRLPQAERELKKKNESKEN